MIRRSGILMSNRDRRLVVSTGGIISGYLSFDTYSGASWRFSETAAAHVGRTSRQHQAMLPIRGVPEGAIPTIGYLAERLRIQHHSAVELVDQLVEAELIMREHDSRDRRRVRLGLTRAAERQLGTLSASHLQELDRMRPAILEILDQIDDEARMCG